MIINIKTFGHQSPEWLKMELFERNKFHHRSGVKLQSQRLNMSIILPVKHCGGSVTQDLDHPFLLETQSSNEGELWSRTTIQNTFHHRVNGLKALRAGGG